MRRGAFVLSSAVGPKAAYGRRGWPAFPGHGHVCTAGASIYSFEQIYRPQ